MSVEIDDEFAFLDIAVQQQQQEVAVELLSAQLMNPLTGALVDTDDIDSLIRACDDAKRQLDDLRCFEDMLRRTIGERATGTTKTRRIRGKQLVAKVEMPDDTWDNSILKEAWNSYPDLRDEFLKISTVGVKLREFKKMVGTTSDDAKFETLKKMISSAKKPATAAPKVTIEM